MCACVFLGKDVMYVVCVRAWSSGRDVMYMVCIYVCLMHVVVFRKGQAQESSRTPARYLHRELHI